MSYEDGVQWLWEGEGTRNKVTMLLQGTCTKLPTSYADKGSSRALPTAALRGYG
jgi:hypothetical protein